jgi:tRNA pseudouridine38-40 synthase
VEKKRFFIALSYQGTDFHGWQIQPNACSVQEKIEFALSTYFRQKISVIGCGRTDTGVHASQYFAHFDLEFSENITKQTAPNSIHHINALLPYTIAIKQIFEVPIDAHARFDAESRTYHYYLHFEKDPFLHQRSWLYKGKLDVEKMNKAAAILLEYTDFSCFSKSNTQTFTNDCLISEAFFEYRQQQLIFTITANRFLRNMVRAIVGTLVKIGEGTVAVEEMHQIIASKNRSNAGQSVPACGLYLHRITYPAHLISPSCQK